MDRGGAPRRGDAASRRPTALAMAQATNGDGPPAAVATARAGTDTDRRSAPRLIAQQLPTRRSRA
ncbi:MAG: hypothetical protein ACK58T_47650 [Phycisphaerae bacterium]